MGKQTLKQKVKDFISKLSFRLFLRSNGITQEQYLASIEYALLNEFPCSCEVASETTMKWNKYCPEHGYIMQRIEKTLGVT